MKLKKIICIIMGFFIFLSIVHAQSYTQPTHQYNEPSIQSFYSGLGVDYTTFWPQSADPEKCTPGNDFFVSVTPGGCTPGVVRSDLLEDQNVPVFCLKTY